ncbi:MAG: carboxypeptidase regulatory-like domain-containing protein [Gemmatimonadota bacterium]
MRPLRLLAGPALAGLAFLAFAWHAAPLAAQGVTTAAISGTITNSQTGAPVEGIVVQVVNASTGYANGAVSNDAGRYFVSGLQVGGPYRVEASGLGYGVDIREGLQLTLGQNLPLDFALRPEAVELAAVAVTVDPTVGQIINPGRTGQQTLVTEKMIANRPSIGRNFTDFLGTSPLSGAGGGSTSLAGSNNRFNSIQLDGVVTQDLFGLGSTGQPGGQAGARSISIEAVKEYQVSAAPYDVRKSGFTGGLVNAVTKTGTNEWKASAFGYYRDQDFVRENLTVDGEDITFGEFENKLYGGTLGGPIVKDRVHFFAAAEIEESTRPGGDVAIGVTTPEETHLAEADAQAINAKLEQLGVSGGGFGAVTVENPNTNFFGRVDAQLSQNHLLTLRHNYVSAEDDNVQNRGGGSFYSFDSNFYFFESKTHSFVAAMNSTFGSDAFNELTFGYTRIRDSRTPATLFPQLLIRGLADPDGSGTSTVQVGSEFFSQANSLDQDSWEIKDNFSFGLGDDHRITLGVQDQIFKFRNLFLSGITGEWTFSNLAAFQAGTPASFRRNVLHPDVDDPNARFSVNNFSVYGQTEYTGIDDVVLTAGLRYDLPTMLDDPIRNEAVEAVEAFGRNTSEMPSGNGTLSPRLGFNWDLGGAGVTQVRGGIGLFTGRQPFVWLSNLYTNTGLFSGTLSCSGANIPVFTLDPDNQPAACGTAAPSFPTPAVNTIDPDFEFPSVWRFDVADDRELPWNIVGTAEFVYSKYNKQIIYRELNVNFDDPVSITQGGRPVFGTHKAGPRGTTPQQSIATPNRRSTAFHQVIDLTNSDQDRAWNFILQAQKQYSDNFEVSASYTLADAEDISGLTSSIATSNVGFNPVAGSTNDTPLRTSDYLQRHKFSVGGTWDVAPWLTWSAFYVANTGDKYSYVYDGDVNADGYENVVASNRFNDLLYVPTDANDITLVDPADWALLDTYIRTEPCLNENRGQILERNVCEEPWRHSLDTRFTFNIPAIRGHHAELVFDLFNVLNFLSEDWGRNQGVSNATIDLLELQGWDVANNRGIFDLDNINLNAAGTAADPLTTFDTSSRWQAQVGLRYEIN